MGSNLVGIVEPKVTGMATVHSIGLNSTVILGYRADLVGLKLSSLPLSHIV